MNWTAIVPLKSGAERKTRLSERLTAAERLALSDRLAAHVLAALAQAGLAARVLSPVAWPGLPWEPDTGAGLNAELDRIRAALGSGPLLAIHADLPLVTAVDIGALIAAAEGQGAAIAPDRADAGTNAIALAGGEPFGFAFGEGSFARHRASLPGAAIVRRAGLALDIDTPADLAASGWG